MPSYPGFCFPTLPSSPLGCQKACWLLFRRPSLQLESQKHLQKSTSSFLPSSRYLPSCNSHSRDTHLLSLAHLPALLGLAALWGHWFLSFFGGYNFHSCGVSFICSSPRPSPFCAPGPMTAGDLAALHSECCFPSLLSQVETASSLLLSSDTGHGSFDITTFYLSFSQIRLFI